MDAQQISVALTVAVMHHLRTNHVRLEDGANDFINGRIAIAAQTISESPADQQQLAQIQKAQDAFRSFIDEMIRAAARIPGHAPGTIGEQTLSAARMKLCPLWPIC